MSINERISALRSQMKQYGIDAYIIPSSDPHQSEYVAEHWTSREWISGFTGSAGTVVITHDHAGLWTDSRYFLQASLELSSSEFILHKVFNQGEPDFIQWISENCPNGSTVGLDGYLFSVNQYERYRTQLEKNQITIKATLDLIDLIWKDRKPLPLNQAFELSVSYAGETRSSKIGKIREKMDELGADRHLVSTLDDIAWILNIRGNDVEFNPVVISYLIIEREQVIWFINPDKVPADLHSSLKNDKISIVHYDELTAYLNNLPVGDNLYIDPSTCSIGMYKAINAKQTKAQLISRALKAVKNSTELSHFNTAMEKDGRALIRFYTWFLKELEKRTITEFEVVQKLASFRSAEGGYHGESFSAIVGYKGNGAIIHYRPDEARSAQIRKTGMLLIDSGGQYNEGTTDITRTFSLGDTTPEEIKAYTLILKGHVALSMAKFPKGTKGVQLDVLARLPLWQNGMNYLHGTGHGVGYFLNVHEPPQGFTAGLSSRGNSTMKPGMVTSNEPGFYLTDSYGIRIENLVVCVKDQVNDFGEFHAFDTITLFPYERDLIDLNLLNDEEREWINGYHKMVFDRLSPGLDGEPLEWLKEKCAML